MNLEGPKLECCLLTFTDVISCLRDSVLVCVADSGHLVGMCSAMSVHKNNTKKRRCLVSKRVPK